MTALYCGFVDGQPHTPRWINDDLHFVLNTPTTAPTPGTAAAGADERTRYKCVIPQCPATMIESTECFALLAVSGELRPSTDPGDLPELVVRTMKLISPAPPIPYLEGEGLTITGSSFVYSCPITGADLVWRSNGTWIGRIERRAP